jgi:hypothetical protein
MPTPTYTPLATVTLGASASSVTFSSIPATYRDLIVVVNGTTTAPALIKIELNSDTNASNYSRVDMRGDSGGAVSVSGNTSYVGVFDSSQTSSAIVQVMDYSATDKHKTFLSRSSFKGDTVRAWVIRWANTAAVNTLRVDGDGNSFATGSTLSLYGVIA